MDATCVRVEVALPSRGRPRSRTRPRATVRVRAVDGTDGGPAAGAKGDESLDIAGGGAETLELPVEVGRRLIKTLGGESALCPPERLRALVSESLDACARGRVEALVGRRDYCARELTGKLLEAGYPRDVAEERTRRAVAAGVVDNARYARSFVRGKAGAGWGRPRIVRELERRGVAREVAEAAADEELGEEDEHARALELASRRPLTGKNDVARIARFLCGRGYSADIAFDVAREVVGSRDGA